MRRSFQLVMAVALAACAPPATPQSPAARARDLAPALAAAFAEEARGDPAAATGSYLDLVDAAAVRPADPWQVAVVSAALDALVFRSVAAFADFAPASALVQRTGDASLLGTDSAAIPSQATPDTSARLATAYVRARGPFARGMIAEGLTALAEFRGDVAEASRWREASGCAREATVVGPLDWMPVTGVSEPDPLEPHDAPLLPSYQSPGGSHRPVTPAVLRGRGCSLGLAIDSARPGVRDVVVDVDVPRDGRVAVELRSNTAATLRAGGRLVLRRPHDLGGKQVTRFAWVDAHSGKMRLVARAGVDDELAAVRVSAWDSEGNPLPTHAPRPGDAASVQAMDGGEFAYPAAQLPAELLGVALAALAAHDARGAEYAIEGAGPLAGHPPDVALAYARAVQEAEDLGPVPRADRARAAYERVLAAWPDAWEAVVGHALLAGAGRGAADAAFAELGDLDALRGRVSGGTTPLLDAFDVAVSGQRRLWDRARSAAERLRSNPGTSALAVAAERVAFDRAPAERAALDCAAHPGRPTPRDTLACHASLRAAGDLGGAIHELDRLRALRGAMDAFLSLTVEDALAAGDRASALRALQDMRPGETTLSAVYGVAALDPARAGPAPETRERLLALLPTARDGARTVGGLLRALRDDPTAELAGVAERLVADDRAHPAFPGGGTVVLRHTERYDVGEDGVVHVVLFDLRRVSGTTDVDENAQAAPPELGGAGTMRPLRRRVLKRDGSVLEPDPILDASQPHASLAQLEAGDFVEAIYEGWAPPSLAGEVSFDGVDLLPDRTAVRQATVEVRYPTALRPSAWSHPDLGSPATQTSAGVTTLRWSLADRAARRVEESTPRADRRVAVSFSTLKWREVARGLREAIARLDDRDPEVDAWARAAVASAHATTERAMVDAIVAAAGASVKESSSFALSDYAFGMPPGPQTATSRDILASHEGSRTWLVSRALHALGVPCDVAVVEHEPISSSPDYPAHLGRFVHPIAVAHVPPDAGPGPRVDLVIDADVPGPPLPAGHLSPELRGRMTLHADGTISPLTTAGSDDGRDEIDLQLTVDEVGDAHGTLSAVLRGRSAQELAQALETTVGDARTHILRDVVLAWMPQADVAAVTLSSTEGSWQVAVRADITVPGYARPQGSKKSTGGTWALPGVAPIHSAYPRSSPSTASATYASESTRQTDLAIARATGYHLHRTITLPPGATVVRLAPTLRVATTAVTASRETRTREGGVLEDDLSLDVPSGTVPREGYAAFRASSQRVDDAFFETTRYDTPLQVPSPHR